MSGSDMKVAGGKDENMWTMTNKTHRLLQGSEMSN